VPVRALSIHGHFYQPPREDPTSGLIPSEYGASPYRNWNERIHAECYLPNAKLGNFEKISFNIGPTLFSWMNSYDPSAICLIVAQDRANQQQYGVGNAIAQAYNHTILPLASREDKITQVAWGIADFEHQYGRKPIGMWLPETAADMETLNILAEYGI
jgi:alpha-amylase/alpha-mannosidase (GH57 family)